MTNLFILGLIILGFVLMTVPDVLALTCEIPEIESPYSIKTFPEEYVKLSCDNALILNKFFSNNCFEVENRLCIYEVIPDLERSKLELKTLGEKNAFRKAINLLEKSEIKLLEVKRFRADILTQIQYTVSRVCSPGDTAVYITINTIMPVCTLASFIYQGTAKELVRQEREVLETNNRGINAALLVLQKEAEELYCIGAGSEYATDSIRIYNKVRDFIRISNLELNGEFEDLPRRWSQLTNRAWKVHEDFEKNGISKCSPAKILNGGIGKESMLPQIIKLYREIREMKISINQKYSSKTIEVKRLVDRSQKEYTYMKKEKYDKILPYHLSYFIKETELDDREFLSIIPVPEFELKKIRTLIEGTGFEIGGKTFYSNSKITYSNKKKFYIIESMKELENAKIRLTIGIRLANKTRIFIEDFLIKAKKIVDKNKEMAHTELEEYKKTSKTDSSLFIEAVKKIDDADKIIFKSNGLPVGEKISNYRESSRLYQESRLILSGKKKYSEIKLDTISELVEKLGNRIKKAQKDGIKTGIEEMIQTNAKSLLKIRKDLGNSEIEDLSISITLAIETIDENARLKYSSINILRKKAISGLEILNEIMDVSEERFDLNKYEKYVVNDEIDFETALGKLNEIKRIYEYLEQKLSERSGAALAEYMSKRAIITINQDQIPIIDKPVKTTIKIKLINELAIGSNKTFVVKIPGVSIGINGTVSHSKGLRVIEINEGISVIYQGIDPFSIKEIKITKTNLEVKTTSVKRNRISINTEEMLEKIDISFESELNLNLARYDLNSLGDSCSAYSNGIQIEMSLYSIGMAEIKNIKKGKNNFYVICKTLNPISSYNSDSKWIDNKLTYNLNIKSNIRNLENVKLTITAPENITKNSLRIYDSSGNPASEFTVLKTGNEYTAKWIVPVLTKDYQIFTVAYDVQEVPSFVLKFREEIKQIASIENIDIKRDISYADFQITNGKYDKAVDSLNRAKKVIDSERNIRIQRNAIKKELEKISIRYNKIENYSKRLIQNGTEINITLLSIELLSEIEKSVIEFNKNKLEIEKLISEDKIKDAYAKLKKSSETKSIEKLLYTDRNRIFKSIKDIGDIIYSLISYTNSEEDVSEIETQQKRISSFIRLMEEGNYIDTGILLAEVSRELEKIKTRLEIKEESVFIEVTSTFAEVDRLSNLWKNEKNKILRITTISRDNPGPQSKITEAKEEILNELLETDKKLSELSIWVKSFGKVTKKSISKNPRTYREIVTQLEEIKDSIVSLKKIDGKYRLIAETEMEKVRKEIDKKFASAKNEEERRTLQQLVPRLSTSNSAYDSGKYLDSIMYSSFILSKINENPDQDKSDMDPLWIVGILIIGGLGTVSLVFLKKDKPLKPKIVESLNQKEIRETEDS